MSVFPLPEMLRKLISSDSRFYGSLDIAGLSGNVNHLARRTCGERCLQDLGRRL